MNVAMRIHKTRTFITDQIACKIAANIARVDTALKVRSFKVQINQCQEKPDIYQFKTGLIETLLLKRIVRVYNFPRHELVPW